MQAFRSSSSRRSPPARGWPGGPARADRGDDAFPARAGMARSRSEWAVGVSGVPRPRGDGPGQPGVGKTTLARSPPARGWPGRRTHGSRARYAFPARAGMARERWRSKPGGSGVPRPRGDGPSPRRSVPVSPARSPPARGWPALRAEDKFVVSAFPARAGMARSRRRRSPKLSRVPRPRGDGPAVTPYSLLHSKRSPPARGWPGSPLPDHPRRVAFPARAGMAREPVRASLKWQGVPRPRGDGPSSSWASRRRPKRSPPARGWPAYYRGQTTFPAAFPARAGMARSMSGRG